MKWASPVRFIPKRVNSQKRKQTFLQNMSIAPPPLIFALQAMIVLMLQLNLTYPSKQHSYSMCYYHKWLQYGPADYEPVEIRMLELFGLAA